MRYNVIRSRIKTGDIVLTSRDDAYTREVLQATGCRWSRAVLAIWGADVPGKDPDRLYVWEPRAGFTMCSDFIRGAEAAVRHLECARTEDMRQFVLWRCRSRWRPGEACVTAPQHVYEDWGLLEYPGPLVDVCFWAGPVALQNGAVLSPLFKVEL